MEDDVRAYRLLSAVILLGTTACATAAPPPASAPRAATVLSPVTAPAITADAVQRHVEFLAGDELLGRDTPSPGLERAAAYLAEHFETLGLRPAGDDGTFIQRYRVERERLDASLLRVEARVGAQLLEPEFGRELFVLPARVDSVVGEPLLAGHARPGAHVPADAVHRLLVFFVPDTLGPAWEAAVSAALQASLHARASGVVLVLDSVFGDAAIAILAGQLATEIGPVPVLGISYAASRALLRHGGVELGAVRADPAFAARPLRGVTLAVRTPIEVTAADVPNVVAVLPGSDPALGAEHVVYSAHFDHVGVGIPDAAGDSIYSGADDNASGTSAVLEVARAFAVLPSAPPRSIMFVMVSGEEQGLLGSRHFVDNPPVPVELMIANINADMIGRNAPDTLVAIGKAHSTLGPTVRRVAERHPELGLVVAPDLWPEEQLFFRSDHFSFAAREVPAIFFTTGLHEDYHRPSDQAHLIDSDKLARVARLLFLVGHELATADERPTWTREGLDEVRRAAAALRF
jgi:hypothetical protein